MGHRRGRGPEGPESRSEALIPALRSAIPDLRLSADANGGYDAAGAIALGRRMEEARFHRFEEPCPNEDLEAAAEVVRAFDVLVSGGEMVCELGKYQVMVRLGAVDIVQCDLGYVGGLTRARRVAALADAQALGFMPHAPNLSMLQILTLHLIASRPDHAELHEWRGGGQPARALAPYAPLARAEGGAVTRPEGPG